MTSVAVVASAVARINCLKKLLQNLPDEADSLLKGLEEIKKSLEAANNRKTKPEKTFMEIEKEIVRLSYDIVDAMASKLPKEESYVRKLTQFKKSGNAVLGNLQKQLNDFQKKLEENEKNRAASGDGPPKGEKKNPEITRDSQVEGEKKGGAEQDEEKDVDLVRRLKEDLLNTSEERPVPVVGIVGVSGMGKTYVARRLFHSQELRSSDTLCAWVPINHNFQIKRVLQVLLQQLGPPKELDIRDINEIQLINHIFSVLENKPYLLVLDDIPAPEDWESIRLALPISHSSRVIITTSSKKFPQPNFHDIPGMTLPETLRLLKEKASFKTGSEGVGEAIFDICGGSPLLATILGKSLQSEAAEASQPELLRDELQTYLSHRGTARVLGACYWRLAPELKPCLLYLGQFPQGQDIEVEKLYLLLFAENLLSTKESEISPQSLHHCLEKLAGKKLVEMQEDVISESRMYKSCRLHGLVLEFCKFKGLDEEFFQIVDDLGPPTSTKVGDLGPPTSKKVGDHTRRLAIDLRKLYKGDNYSITFDSPNTSKKILSLLIFDSFESAAQKSEWPSGINELKEFIHLRILNFDGVNFTVRKVPRGLDRLVLLRYLSFRGCRLEKLPSSISSLTQLETLDLLLVQSADCSICIPSNIFADMKRMLHLYFPRQYTTSGKSNAKLQLQGMEKLEILVNFDTEACDVKDLLQLKSLKILSTISHGQSKELNEVIGFINSQNGGLSHSSVYIRNFDCYNGDSFSSMEKLVRCQFVHSIHVEGKIYELPKGDINVAGKVSEMVLDGSELEDDPMDYLGKMFPNLRSLVLSNDAFLGGEMVVSAVAPFPNLRSLKLQNLQYLEKIRIERGTMPKLSTLLIDGCGCLGEVSIPKELDEGLTKAQRDNGGDAYSIMPPPKLFLKA